MKRKTTIPKLLRSSLREASVLFTVASRWVHPKMRVHLEPVSQKRQALRIEAAIETITETEERLLAFLENSPRATFMVVGTNPRISAVVSELFANNIDFPVSYRWTGGFLTNFESITWRQRTLKQMRIDSMTGTSKDLGNKKQMMFKKEKARLERRWGDLLHLRRLPSAMIVINPRYEKAAVLEARKIGIPIFAISRTNVNPHDFAGCAVLNEISSSAIHFVLDRWRLIIADVRESFAAVSKESKLPSSNQDNEYKSDG